MRKLCVALASLCLVACQGSSTSPAATAEQPTPQPSPVTATTDARPSDAGSPSQEVETFGAPLTAGETLTLAQVLSAPDSFADKAIRVTGHVRKACSKKGCWMELAASADKASQGARVTFKDYGFFVPLNSAGSSATVEGVVTLKTVEASEVEHLEAEGARFEKKFPDGSAREVRLIATGVELRGRDRS